MDDNSEDDIEPLSEWPPPCGGGGGPKDITSLTVADCTTAGVSQAEPEVCTNYSVSSCVDRSIEAAGACSPKPKKRARHWSQNEEPLASVGLARWWRHQGKTGSGVTLPELQGGHAPKTCNPNTLLRYIARTPEARQFMKSEVRRLSELVHRQAGSVATANVHAALGSYLEKLQDWQGAQTHLQGALRLQPDAREYQWLLHRVRRQQQVLSAQQQAMHHQLPKTLPTALHTKQVERRTAEGLSFPEFFFRYALSSTPVVITGLARAMTSTVWDLQHVRDVAGPCQTTLKHLVPDSVEWAQMEDCHTTTVREFIDSLPSQNTLPPEKQTYLFDWSLPIHCPALAQELVIPKYFAGDFLQRSSPGSLYQDSWPSLFIAPAGLRSELHIDAFGSNFWMALFEGRKRWVFFSKEDVPLLYPSYEHSMDPVFEVDLANPDFGQHPLLSLAKPMECILQPGDVLFVPAGCPHRVENLEQSVAISANFVDLSNLGFVKRELAINGLQDQRAAELLTQLRSPQMHLKMHSAVPDMDWQTFKQWPKDYTHHDY